MVKIVPYKKDFYSAIQEWWHKSGEDAPSPDAMTPENSFVCYVDEEPALAVSLYVTNGPVAWVDNFVGNPELKAKRLPAVKVLLSYLEWVAQMQGKSKLFCMSVKKSTSRRYEQLGFTKTVDAVSTFIKEIN